MTFVKGQSGNPRGRPKKEQCFADMFRAALAVPYGDQQTTARQLLVNALIKEAVTGNVPAAKLIIAYTDGPPPQEVKVDHEGEIAIVDFRAALADKIARVVGGAGEVLSFPERRGG